MKNTIAMWVRTIPSNLAFHARTIRCFQKGITILNNLGCSAMDGLTFNPYNFERMVELVKQHAGISENEFKRMKAGTFRFEVKTVEKTLEQEEENLEKQDKDTEKQDKNPEKPNNDPEKPIVRIAKVEDKVSFRQKFYPGIDWAKAPNECHTLLGLQITALGKWKDARRELENEGPSFERCQQIVESYLEELAVIAELKQYEKKGSFLKKHPMFWENEQKSELASKSAADLAKIVEKAKERAKRNDYELKKGDKPHLNQERQAKIAKEKKLVSIVEEILASR